jgi:hypothetical protein
VLYQLSYLTMPLLRLPALRAGREDRRVGEGVQEPRTRRASRMSRVI